MNATPITIEALPGYIELDDDSGDNYYKASQRKAFLSSEIINPFEDSLKEFTDYNDDNIPSSDMEVTCDIGDLRFVLNATPTKKRPGYKEVFEEIDGYLRTRLAEYNAGERPVGIFTIEGQPYISANEVLEAMGKQKRKVTSKGVKVSIARRPDVGINGDSIVVPLGMDLYELTEGNAMRYLEALGMCQGYDDIISGFEQDLLGFTGFSNDNPPEQTEHMYRQVGRHIFHVKSVPYETISYGKVISGLDKKPGKKKVENGGDLTLVTNDIEVPRLGIYKTKIREGDHLVRLKALIKRIDKLVEGNTETKVRQKPINHYPIV